MNKFFQQDIRKEANWVRNAVRKIYTNYPSISRKDLTDLIADRFRGPVLDRWQRIIGRRVDAAYDAAVRRYASLPEQAAKINDVRNNTKGAIDDAVESFRQMKPNNSTELRIFNDSDPVVVGKGSEVRNNKLLNRGINLMRSIESDINGVNKY